MIYTALVTFAINVRVLCFIHSLKPKFRIRSNLYSEYNSNLSAETITNEIYRPILEPALWSKEELFPSAYSLDSDEKRQLMRDKIYGQPQVSDMLIHTNENQPNERINVTQSEQEPIQYEKFRFIISPEDVSKALQRNTSVESKQVGEEKFNNLTNYDIFLDESIVSAIQTAENIVEEDDHNVIYLSMDYDDMESKLHINPSLQINLNDKISIIHEVELMLYNRSQIPANRQVTALPPILLYKNDFISESTGALFYSIIFTTIILAIDALSHFVSRFLKAFVFTNPVLPKVLIKKILEMYARVPILCFISLSVIIFTKLCEMIFKNPNYVGPLMTANAIDYFCTLGKKNGSFCCKSFQDHSQTPHELWNSAITDIIITRQPESFDDTWTFQHVKVDQLDASFGFQRRHDSKRMDHITNIKLFEVATLLPKGYEVIKSIDPNAHSNLMNNLGLVAVKRADTSNVMFIEGEQIITDIQIINKGDEECSDEYTEVENISHIKHSQNELLNGYLALIIQIKPPIGLCDLSYESSTIDRYPKEDHRGMPLPVNELPMFAFPNDLKLSFNSLNRFPLPVFFTFVFTDAVGDHLYAACLRFYESVPNELLNETFRMIYGDEHKFEVLPGSGIFCPKVICVISKMPFYRAMRRYLRQIYSLSLSTLQCPLEHFIVSLVSQVPIPMEGGRPFHVMLDAALISTRSRAMAPIIFQLPPLRFFPTMDLDFAGPLRCLSVDNLLVVFTLMLMEAKLLFICRSNTLLTETMETFRMLLFPLAWSSCFISRLPQSLNGVLEAPGGFMVGIHVSKISSPNNNNKSEDVMMQRKSNFSHQSFQNDTIHQVINYYSVQRGTFLVDLSSNSIIQYDGNPKPECLSDTTTENILKSLPIGPRIRLRHKLQKIAVEYQIGAQLIGLEEFDSAFDFQSQDDAQISIKKWEEFPTLELRDSFMVFMIDLLGNYPAYIIPPMEDLNADTYRTFKELFSVDEYLADADPNYKLILEKLMETQMFAVLLQQRSEGNDFPLVFFENAAILLKELGLSTGGHGHKSLSSSSAVVCELPVPLHELMDIDSKWSSLTADVQQKIMDRRMHVPIETKNTTKLTDFQLKLPANLKKGGAITSPPSTPVAIFHLIMIHSTGLPHSHPVGRESVGGAGHSPAVVDHSKISLQQATNEKLINLLTLMSVTKPVLNNGLHGSSHSNLDENDPSMQASQHARQELDKNEDFMLYDPNFGPLVIPGPIKHDFKFHRDQGTIEDIEEKESYDDNAFSYQSGWPQFDQNVLNTSSQEVVHPRLKDIRRFRMLSIQKINKKTLILLRSPTERYSFENHGKLWNNLQIEGHQDAKAAISAVLDVASMAITLLGCRVLHFERPCEDILQMIGILAQIEHWGMLRGLSESTWRCGLVSCAEAGGDLSRRVACTLFESAQNIFNTTDSLTYGQYLRALSAKESHNTKNKQILNQFPLDQCLYLEELGLTWYIQKAALIEHAQVSYNNSPHTSFNNPPETQSRLSVASNGKVQEALQVQLQQLTTSESHKPKPNNAIPNPSLRQFKRQSIAAGSISHLTTVPVESSAKGREAPSTRRLVIHASTEAAKTVSSRWSLTRSTGLLSFMRPISLITFSAPRRLEELESINQIKLSLIIAGLKSRMDKVIFEANEPIVSYPPISGQVSRERGGSTISETGQSKCKTTVSRTSSGLSMNSTVSSSSLNLSKKSDKPGLMQNIKKWSTGLISSQYYKSPTTASTPPAHPTPTSLSSQEFTPTTPVSATFSPSPKYDGAVNMVKYRKNPEMHETLVKICERLDFDDDDDDGNDGENEGDAGDEDEAGGLNVSRKSSTTEAINSSSDVKQIEVSQLSNNEQPEINQMDITEQISMDVLLSNDNIQREIHLSVSPDKVPPNNFEGISTDVSNKNLLKVTSGSVPGLKDTSAIELQNQIIESFRASFVHDGQAIGIHNYNACGVCKYAMMDEEILGLWCQREIRHSQNSHHLNSPIKSPSNDEKVSPSIHQIRKEDARNMLKLHEIGCPGCGSMISPKLHVVCYKLKDSLSMDKDDVPNNVSELERRFRTESYHDKVEEVWCKTVSYFSPFGLRYELEKMIEFIGEHVSDMTWLETIHPSLYWGIVWYTTRLNLPMAFKSTKSNLHDPSLKDAVCILNPSQKHTNQANHDKTPSNGLSINLACVIGWRQIIVKSKIYQILNGNFNSFDDNLEIIDFFPQCNETELSELYHAVHCLDDSLVSLRQAIITLAKCNGVMNIPSSSPSSTSLEQGGSKPARRIYVNLLTLCYLRNRSKLIIIPTIIPKCLTKEIPFENLFRDTVKCLMSKSDEEIMKCSNMELINCVADRTTQTMRIGFGFLY